MREPMCPQAWHGGLSVGLLRECARPPGHRGQHADGTGALSWGGKLTEGEMLKAEALRWEAHRAQR